MSDNDNEQNRLLSNYGELYVLLECDPKILHEAIYDCEPEQLEEIMGVMEDQLGEIPNAMPSRLDTIQQFLAVWFIALRAWDKKTSPEDKQQVTDLDFETLKYDQYWE
jgi:hypothetical protein